jgi:hypothetical protein
LVLFFKKELLAFCLLARLDYGSTIKAAGLRTSQDERYRAFFASTGAANRALDGRQGRLVARR